MAFVLIKTETGFQGEMLKNIKAIPEVQETHIICGAYDMIAKIKTETMQDLKEIISWKIRRLDKVRSILTMIVI